MPRISWSRAGERSLIAAGVTVLVVGLVGVGLAASGGAPEAGGDAPRPTDAPAEPIASTSTTQTTTVMATTTSSSISSSTSSSTSTTSTTLDSVRLATLREGDRGPEVSELQRLLNAVSGAGVAVDGIYGPATTAAVLAFQRFVGLPGTGDAEHETRILLATLDASRADTTPAWPLPTIGDGGADGCQVAVVGDSLMAGAPTLHEARLRELGCTSTVDAVSSRSLNHGWQCKVVKASGSRRLVLLPEPQPGDPTCAPSGLQLMQMWADAGARGDVIVVALGTNDAGLFTEPTWIAHWRKAIELAGGRPVVFVTTQARPGDGRVPTHAAYSAALRRWCVAVPTCVLGDWAVAPTANDPASYVDSVHLTSAATDARARFVRDVVGALLTGTPNPAPLTTTTSTTTSTTTTTTTTTTTWTTAPRSTTSTSMPRTSTTSSSSTSTSTSTTLPV